MDRFQTPATHNAKRLPACSALQFGGFTVQRITMLGQGAYGLSYDAASCALVGQNGPACTSARWTFFQVDGTCDHCESLHQPVFAWDGSRYFVIDDGGIDFTFDPPAYLKEANHAG
jgi:hypothetical protein